MGDYQPLRSDEAHAANTNANHHVNKPNVYYAKPMSPLCKVAFILSIFVCFATIITFLWVIPCDWSKCPLKSNHQSIMSWDRSIEGLEIKGQMKIVRGAQGLNLVAMFQGALQGYDAKDHFPPKTGGLICFVGANGYIAWFIRMPVPTHFDCVNLRIRDSSQLDCLVRGVNGYLTLVDSFTGMAKWRAQSPTAGQSLTDSSFPIVIPDVDGDGWRDLAVTGSIGEHNHRLIAIISGDSGFILGKPIEMKGCTEINNLTLDRDYMLYYTCKNSTNNMFSERLGQINLAEAVQAMTNHSVTLHGSVPQVSTHTGNEWTVNNYRLNLVNSGHSPADYQVSLTVRNEYNHTVWSPTMPQTYAMTPVVLRFQQAISGFLLKFWYWHSLDQKKDSEGNIVNNMSERVVLVTFNATGSAHIVNASQTDIVQLCFNKTCQPELAYHTESLLIVDLDEDGRQELISYLVTFQPRQKPNSWKLQSKVRLIRLEAELPKLYETIERH